MKRPQFGLLELVNIMFVVAVIAAYVGAAIRSVQPQTPRSLLDKGPGVMLYVDDPKEGH